MTYDKTEDKYKLYRTVHEIIHPTISKKNISNYIHEALKSNQSWNIDVSKYSKVDNEIETMKNVKKF